MWRDILLANRQQVVEASQRCIGRLQELVRVVENADPVRIESLIRQGQLTSARLKDGNQ